MTDCQVMVQSRAATVDEYLDELTDERRTAVSLIRQLVLDNLPDGYELIGVEPALVEVRMQGQRRDLYLAAASDLSVDIDALLVQLGRRTFELSLAMFDLAIQNSVMAPSGKKFSIGFREIAEQSFMRFMDFVHRKR